MKKCTVFTIMILLIGLLTGCKASMIQKRQQELQAKTDDLYWYVDVLNIHDQSRIAVVQQKGDRRVILEAKLRGRDLPKDYSSFLQRIQLVSINDSRKTEKLIWVSNSNHQFAQEPEVIDLTQSTPVEEEGAFNLNKNEISIKSKWIDNLHEIDTTEVGFADWAGYMADFDVTKAKGVILTDGEKGRVVILFDQTGEKMREAFVTYKGLDYVRHVEAGEIIDENLEVDPDRLVEIIWKVWSEKLKPFQQIF